jgi:purine nucleosidase
LFLLSSFFIPSWGSDAGVDDAYALVMAIKLSQQHNYQLKLITTVFGNCSLPQVIQNVSKIRHACGLSTDTGPKISSGCCHPIIKETMMDATYFHGNDGLGNNTFPSQESGIEDENLNRAAEDLIQLCHEAKEKNEKVTLIMLGPLTNLARAISIQDDIVTYLDEIYIMGGCGNGHGNVKRTTEFNITADCEAASIVFNNLCQHEKLCTIISWELTLENTIPWDLFDEMNSEESDKTSSISSFFRGISQFSYHPDKRIPIPHFSIPSEHFHGAVICDALAVAIALDPQNLIQSQTLVHVDVELKGELTRGQTVVDWGCYDGIVRTKNCQWVLVAKSDVFVEMFRKMYSS